MAVKKSKKKTAARKASAKAKRQPVKKKALKKKAAQKKKVKKIVKSRPKPKAAKKKASAIKIMKGSDRPQSGGKQESQEKLRQHLVDHRKRIIREAKEEIAKFIKGEERQLVDTALDDGDWSLVDLSEDINLRKLTTHKETLNKIDEAIRKLREGTYGICEDCGAEISEARLKVIPFAIYCIDCKEKRERMEEFEREEEF